jgi:hypothetical protein
MGEARLPVYRGPESDPLVSKQTEVRLRLSDGIVMVVPMVKWKKFLKSLMKDGKDE